MELYNIGFWLGLFMGLVSVQFVFIVWWTKKIKSECPCKRKGVD